MFNKKLSVGLIASLALSLFAGTNSAIAASSVTSATTAVNLFSNHLASCTNANSDMIALVINSSNKVVLVSKGSTPTTTVVNTTAGNVSDAAFIDPFVCAFSPDGTTLFVGNDSQNNNGDFIISIVNVASGVITGYLTTESSAVGVSVTPDGSKLLMISSYNHIYAYYLSGGTTNINLNDSNFYGNVTAWDNATIKSRSMSSFFYPDTNTLRIFSKQGSLETLNLTTGAGIAVAKEGIIGNSTEVYGSKLQCENADHSLVAISDGNDAIGVFNAETGETVSTNTLTNYTASGELMSCLFTPAGEVIFAGDPDTSIPGGEVKVFNSATGAILETISTPDTARNTSMLLSDDGKLYVMGKNENISIIVLDAAYLGASAATKKTITKTIYFGKGASKIDKKTAKALKALAKKYKSGYKIVITGYTESSEPKTGKKLGTARANAVKALFKKNKVKVADIKANFKKMAKAKAKGAKSRKVVITITKK